MYSKGTAHIKFSRIANPALILLLLFIGSVVLLTSPSYTNAFSQDECINVRGGYCRYDACVAPDTQIGTCDYGGFSVRCCAAPSSSTTTTGVIPDTTCNVDQTYVALTDTCISVPEFNTFIFNLLILAGVMVSIFRATMGFFLFLTAEGSPDKLQGGREALTQAIVGLVIVVGGWVFIQAFQTFLPSTWSIFLVG